MIREEYITAAGAYFERLLMPIQELPDDRFDLPVAEGAESVHELFADLALRAERMVRALELLFHGKAYKPQAIVVKVAPEFKRTLATFRIAHSTVIAALERVPLERFGEEGELPEWLLIEYLTPLETAAPRVDKWATAIRARGLGGVTGLPVIQ